MATDLITRLQTTHGRDPIAALEREMDANLGHLEQVCLRPEARLSRVEQVDPLSRAQRTAPRALSHLAAHTEDWERRTIRGVYPKRLLSVHNEPDVDLYENQVAVRLVDHLLAFLEWRRSSLQAALDMLKDLDDLQELTGQLNDRHWWTTWRLASLLGELVSSLGQLSDSDNLRSSASDLLRRTRERRARLERLRASRLCQNRRLRRHGELPSDLRQTNLFTHHQEYRRVGALWRAWARASREADIDASFSLREFCDGFDRFVGLLIARSLGALGYRATSERPPVPGSQDVVYARPSGDVVVLRNQPDGTFELFRDGARVLIIVPLPHPLAAEPSRAALHAFLDDPGATAQPEGGPARIIVYPGTREEQRTLPPRLLSRIDTVGNDVREGTAAGILPVAPTEIDSVERMIRAVQWALVAPDAAAYPPAVRCPAEMGEKILAGRGTWLGAGELDQLMVLRPPAQAELEHVTGLMRAWSGERGALARRRERDSAAAMFHKELEAALGVLDRLSICPVCGKKAEAEHQFTLRKGTFRIACARCRNDWGTQTCRWCKAPFPTVQLRRTQLSSDPGPVEASGHGILATSCQRAGQFTFYICPNCGRCGNEGARAERPCHRCDVDDSPPDHPVGGADPSNGE
ncbi:hypothetical protein [Nonomuraea sp. NPDC048901]|uniref:hypothetical protein n=1 Tax=Nonomuraea sp. NPDC048901 TaxID=3155627 RepID=UPI0033E68F80